VTVTVRLAPLPPKVMLAVGARVGLLDALLRISAAGSVSPSPTTNGMAPVLEFTAMLRSVMSVMVGGVLVMGRVV
jgi:hypothetical protein